MALERRRDPPGPAGSIQSGKYDVIHYAGHAAFDEISPARSGLLCAGGTPLTGADLASVSNLPTVVFFNACESGRVRRAVSSTRAAARTRASRSQVRLRHINDGVGLAKAIYVGGVANFLGTYWPVGDFAAKTFADRFYAGLPGRVPPSARPFRVGGMAVKPRSKGLGELRLLWRSRVRAEKRG